MHTKDYTQAVLDIVDDLRAYRRQNPDSFRFSDIAQEVTAPNGETETRYYVNLVQEGGGILGVALLGFTYVLEELGIRFLSLGGTSAGAINTLLMADAGTPGEKKSLRILEKIVAKDFMDFVDGGNDAEQLTRLIQRGVDLGNGIQIARNLPAILQAAGNLDELFGEYGVNPGDEFEQWLSGILQHKSWHALKDNLETLPDDLYRLSDYGNNRKPVGKTELKPRLAIMAADITTQTKVEFPRMAPLYYEDGRATDPACFVRASMAIPFFFTPKRVSLAWKEGRETELRRRWRRVVGYKGTLPDEILFVDGGVMSNFPIDVFHRADAVPAMPTIGVKLGIDRAHATTITGLGQFLGNMQEGVRNLRDLEFIRNNPEYKDLVEYIDIEGFSWLNFSISDADKIRLFRKGAEAAANFLRRFDWRNYKANIKASLLERIKPVLWELSNVKDLDTTLSMFKIDNKEAVKIKINRLEEREREFRILWIDDSLTYPLPMAILDRLHTTCDTVRNSNEALRRLTTQNKQGGTQPYELIISDVTRHESDDEEANGHRGLLFAEQLSLDPELKSLPILFYAHRRKELEERHGKALPPNVVNTPDRYTILHGDFIAEVVDALHEPLTA